MLFSSLYTTVDPLFVKVDQAGGDGAHQGDENGADSARHEGGGRVLVVAAGAEAVVHALQEALLRLHPLVQLFPARWNRGTATIDYVTSGMLVDDDRFAHVLDGGALADGRLGEFALCRVAVLALDALGLSLSVRRQHR